MRTNLAVLILLSTLAGCGAMHDSVNHANDNLYQGGAATRQRLARAIYDDGTSASAPDAQRYCYDVRSDIICYDQPQPDLRKIVGAQGYGRGNDMNYNTNYNADPAPSYSAESSTQYRNSSDVAATQSESYVPTVPQAAGDGETVTNGLANSAYNGDAPQSYSSPLGGNAPQPLIQGR